MADFIWVYISAILLLAAFVLSIWTMRRHEIRKWNKGKCRDCGGRWKQFSTDSQGGRGYKCPGCSRHIWISYKVDK